ncbi:MAG: hypothetical protein AAGA31_15000 [Bacteroidota bacterium]
MYTSEDVLEMMDSLPVAERLLVVEETLRKIRITEVDPPESAKPVSKHWFSPFIGSIDDNTYEEYQQALLDTSKIDEDGWNLSF